MPANRNLTLDLKPEPGVKMAALIGKWSYESTSNVDALMDKLGVPDALKQMVKNSKPTIEISQSGDTWSFLTQIGDKTRDIKFKLGEEFETVALTGDTVKSVITLEGDALVEKYPWKEFNIEVNRQVVGGKLVTTMTAGGETAIFNLSRDC